MTTTSAIILITSHKQPFMSIILNSKRVFVFSLCRINVKKKEICSYSDFLF